VIHVLTGDNVFALQERLKGLVNGFVVEYGDLALQKIDGVEATYDDIREALESMPFLVSKKLVVLRAPGAVKEFTEHAQDLLGSVGDETHVIIIEPRLDKRSAYYKYIKTRKGFEEFKELDVHTLASWVVERAKQLGATISASDARYVVERVGSNQQMIAQEIAKLAAYDAVITRKTIDLLCEQTPQSTVFELIDALFDGRTDRATVLYQQQRQSRVEPQQIIAMLAWQLHAAALVKTAQGLSDADIARQAKLNPYVVSKTRRLVTHLSLTDIKRLVTRILHIDVESKSGKIDIDEALQNLFAVGV